MDFFEIVAIWIFAAVFFILFSYFLIYWTFHVNSSAQKDPSINKFVHSFYYLALLAILEFIGIIFPLVKTISMQNFKYAYLLNFNTTLNFVFSPQESILQCGNAICTISNSSSISIENFSFIISIITGILVLTYFLGMIESSSNLVSDGDGKKYLWFFVSITILSIVFVVSNLESLLFGYITQTPNNLSVFDTGIVVLALVNIIFCCTFAVRYKVIIDDYKLLDTFNIFLDDSLKQSNPDDPIISKIIKPVNNIIFEINFCSALIFITIIATAFYSYSIRDVNIFSVIFFECSLVFLHIGVSRIFVMPRWKYKFELNNKRKINGVFVLFETNDYYKILCPKNQFRKIMKQSISQIIEIKKLPKSNPPKDSTK